MDYDGTKFENEILKSLGIARGTVKRRDRWGKKAMNVGQCCRNVEGSKTLPKT